MFFIGLLLGLVIGAAAVYLIKSGVRIKWYEWLLGAIAMLFLFATVQHYVGSLNEYETQSAWMGALIFGVLGVILAGVTFQLVWRHNKST